MEDTKKTKIRELNDLTRKQIFVPQPFKEVPATIVHTQGIEALSDCDREAVYLQVRGFTAFCEDNDPHQEHDFGAFDHGNQKIFWKIDYYALDLQQGSENPADIKQTMRVLTLMLASEY